jgi:hypothetical protein
MVTLADPANWPALAGICVLLAIVLLIRRAFLSPPEQKPESEPEAERREEAGAGAGVADDAATRQVFCEGVTLAHASRRREPDLKRTSAHVCTSLPSLCLRDSGGAVTTSDLAGCDGAGDQPLLIGVNGDVFDLLSQDDGVAEFGPGKERNAWTGRLVTQC